MKYSTTAGAVGLGLVASLAATSATLVEFRQNLVAMAPHERNRIQFNEYEVHPVPHVLLGMAAPDEAKHPSCELLDKTKKTDKAEILISMSNCLSEAAVDNIKAWIASISKESLKHANADGSVTEMTFATTSQEECPPGTTTKETPKVDDKATKETKVDDKPTTTTTTTTTDYGGGYKSQALLANSSSAVQSKHQHQHALSGELLRLQAFSQFGRVLADAPPADVAPIAVLAFTASDAAYEKVTKAYTATNKFFNFQMCPSGVSCTTRSSTIKLTQPIDLFQYNPFKIIRAAECKKLDGGIPVTYTPKGSKETKCFCMCPTGTEYTVDGYTGVASCARKNPDVCDCVWKDSNNCIDNDKPLEKCLFSNLATTWNVPVPFPLDNYVADSRANGKDGPQIDLIYTKIATDVYTYDSLKGLYETSQPGKTFVADTLQSSTKGDLVNELTNGKPGSLTASATEAVGKPVVKIYEWKEYQQHRAEKIDSIELEGYGKYKLELVASDYDVTRNAKCEGCVSVVDKFRPVSKNKCLARLCDTALCGKETDADVGVVEATADQVDKLATLAEAVYKFQKDVTNDQCKTKRCDTNTFAIKDWFTTVYDTTTTFDDGKTCLDKAKLQASLKQIAKDKPNPLAETPAPTAPPVYPAAGTTPAASIVAKQTEEPVAPYTCRRCCKYGVELKEWWVDYKCGYDYDISRCSGLGKKGESKCDLEQCVVLDGKTLASASVCLKDSVRSESQKVLDQLEVSGFQAVTQVHRALTCTSFDTSDPSKPPKPECVYEAAVGDLVDATYKTEFFDGDADKYVFWRYRITGDAEGWKLWNPKQKTKPTDKYKFTGPETKVTIEAWTACGRVHQSFFFVRLHLQTEIKVCDFFPKMWYQTTTGNADITASLCAYPGSDFAELTFDYQANIGLQYARGSLRMEVTAVQCSLSIENRKPVDILSIQGKSMDILQRYAVELHTLKNTAPNTKFNVVCSFTYARFDGTTKVEKCQQPFTIKDCDGPTIDVPPGGPTGTCNWDKCAGESLPGPYEACGGNVVSSTLTATTLKVMTDDKCCKGCTDTTPTCTSILDVPEASDNDIKRCVPQTPPGEYGAYGAYSSETTTGTYGAAKFMAQATARHPTAAAATVLLAASAMVALVALVVVRQRRATGQDAEIIEDAYYPLLN